MAVTAPTLVGGTGGGPGHVTAGWRYWACAGRPRPLSPQQSAEARPRAPQQQLTARSDTRETRDRCLISCSIFKDV